MNKPILAIAIALLTITGASEIALALLDSENIERQPVTFYSGHTHDKNGHALGAPAHSGGLDRKGCHNKSVPYHCH